MKKMVGYTERFTATVGVTRAKKGGSGELVVLLENVHHNGKIVNDHCWVEKQHPSAFPKKGKKIEFTSTVYRYLSVDDECKQVNKVGLTSPHNIKEL